jgi:hypothetical protein
MPWWLEFMGWRQKTSKRETKWNELKGELNNLLDVTPILNLIDETTFHHHLIAYESVFLDFKVDDVFFNTSNNLKDNNNVEQNSLNNINVSTHYNFGPMG